MDTDGPTGHDWPRYSAATDVLEMLRGALRQSENEAADAIDRQEFDLAKSKRSWRITLRQVIDILAVYIPSLDPPSIDPASTVTIYSVIYERLIPKARELGYALALHGSMKRDLDLIAVPWIQRAMPGEQFARALADHIDGRIYYAKTDKGGKTSPNPTPKPHGRMSWTIHLKTHPHFYIDLAVMPIMPADGVCEGCGIIVPMHQVSAGRMHEVPDYKRQAER